MKKREFEEVDALIQSLDGETTELTTKQYNSAEELANSIYLFLENQLQAIQKQEAFKSVVVKSLIDKIQTEELEFNELIRLFETISRQENNSVETIMNTLRPNSNGAGVGDRIFRRDNDEVGGGTFDSLSSKDRVAIDRFMRLLNSKDATD